MKEGRENTCESDRRYGECKCLGRCFHFQSMFTQYLMINCFTHLPSVVFQSLDILCDRKIIEVLLGIVYSMRQGSRLNGKLTTWLVYRILFSAYLGSQISLLFTFRSSPFYDAWSTGYSWWYVDLVRTRIQRRRKMNQGSSQELAAFALKFNGCLASSVWGRWRFVALPLLYGSVLGVDIDSILLG